jgi:topoisomerase IA-like protein
MSNLKFLHKVENRSFKDGVSKIHEESIVDGQRGISIKFFKKDDSGVERIHINGKDNKYVMKTRKGDKTDEKVLTKDELLAELNKNKSLKFAAEFAKTQKGGRIFGGKKSSKKMSKSSKKTSKKMSKKSSKKVSKSSKK